MITVNLPQGSPEWHAHRAKHFNASDAPAMMGVSPYQTRDELLRRLKTGLTQEVDAATQRRFDDGHRFEALARPVAEKLIGEDLYPVTGTEGKYSASFDGITMMEDITFEHKTLNDDIRAAETFGLPDVYRIQIEHQFMVSGAKKCLFLATKWNGDELLEQVEIWVEPDLELRAKIVAGWDQLERDLASYVPQEFKERIKADAVEAMPAPSIVVKGELVACNMVELSPVFDKFLAETKTELKTDEDFAQGEANAKTAREAAKTLKLTAKAVIDQIAPVSQVVATIDAYVLKFDALGLKLEKAVKEQKASIKTNAVLAAQQDWQKHIADLELEIKPTRMSITMPDFAEASKGVKTIAGLHSKINDALAAGKAEANTQAQDLRSKLAWCKQNAEGYDFLFSDMQQIIFKPMDDFQLLVTTRVKEHKEAEQARINAEAERIAAEQIEAQRQEDERKAQEEERLRNAAEQYEEQQRQRQAQPVTQVQTSASPAVETRPAASALPVANDVPDTGATIKLGEIATLLGFSVTADFITSLGFSPSGRERSAVLYREVDLPNILEAIANHVHQVRADFIMRKAA